MCPFPHPSSVGKKKMKAKRKKKGLSINGQLMMSYHYTQILRSPSKPVLLHADWLFGCERGRVMVFLSFFFCFPHAPGLIPVPEWAHPFCFSLSYNLSQKQQSFSMMSRNRSLAQNSTIQRAVVWWWDDVCCLCSGISIHLLLKIQQIRLIGILSLVKSIFWVPI